ncbi:uncharacterized protein DSM5745_07038 [Aspergillus mulundensis]|uniref:Uncharacterized protein n=1 Tax=Aspergillus mulundensis TaxID=1810919 RepID=A0A3D8RKA0_9EURO|nr:Uncharacterized protein DSM5745_07038 [Aspergillus mulundensis]RDW74376.1 Uncharacterized protein DSM5745_07038 [Aspergillus mulundensis]
MARPYLFLLAIIATIFSPATAGLCNFWDTECVDPLAQTAISITFPPLFLESINFYYAFDADARGKGQEPMTKAGFWIGYEAYVNNSAIDINRTSEIAVRVGNLTGTPSGNNNGCDGVWGSDCSMNLKNYLRQTLFDLVTSGKSYQDPLRTVIGSFRDNPPPVKNCPPPLFDVQRFPVEEFAVENEEDMTAVIKKTGNSDSPWSTFLIDNMTAAEQAEQVAVGIITRTPMYGSAMPRTQEEIQLELVCAQAPSPGTSSSSDD